MPDAAKLIEELAARIESGKQVDFGRILETHAQIERLHETLKAEFGERAEPARTAREADVLIEKIILEYVANTSTALRDLGLIVASMNRSAITRIL
ncbi:MAG TPA: hypothetical protein VHX86_08230 [Tepidisphaeraceae bacterium]|jgi:Skp family chaperone for outer membrane proteins|nr:hypothetical protein [Tepidisphaeraceae bacterium]